MPGASIFANASTAARWHADQASVRKLEEAVLGQAPEHHEVEKTFLALDSRLSCLAEQCEYGTRCGKHPR
jgi:hypothetical protein